MEKSIKRKKAPKVEPKHAPVLLPAHIALLGQTGLEAPDLDISPWLHGSQSGSADVSLIWRADLQPESSGLWGNIVSLRPPITQEALEIPVYAARAWLEGLRVQEVSDLEGIQLSTRKPGDPGKPVLRWRGPDDCQVISPEEIRPGDTLILPSNYGGCDSYGWDPKSITPVMDIADFCSLERQKDHVVRLVPGLTGWLGEAEETIHDSMLEVVAAETEVDPETGIDEDRVKTAHNTLRVLIAEVDHPLLRRFNGHYEVELHPNGLVLRDNFIDEVDAALSGGVAVELDRHLEGVAQLAETLTSGHSESERILSAARHHDRGKVEPRFQVMLHGNSVAAAAGPTLAKSGLRKLSEKRAAYTLSNLPKGFRHELASLAYAETLGLTELDVLVRYLIATHHGYGRPWFPICADQNAPGTVYTRFESGWIRSYAALMAFYGPWKLAGMELGLRASDIRQSMKEQEEKLG